MTHLTKQEMFDRVAVHLVAQGAKCVNIEGTGAYRGPANRQCAAGIFMPDDVWSEEINLQSANLLDPEKFFPAIDPNDFPLLLDLQDVHDNASDDDEFATDIRFGLSSVARVYGLNTDVLDAAP